MAVLSGVAMVLIALAAWILVRSRENAEKRERRRRQHVNLTGRLGDALITEAGENSLYYTYSVNGVEYSASQDVTSLRGQLPAELGRLVGIANIKYSPRNPANSILLCEQWSGLRERSRAAAG